MSKKERRAHARVLGDGSMGRDDARSYAIFEGKKRIEITPADVFPA
jgi:hypothetical protein